MPAHGSSGSVTSLGDSCSIRVDRTILSHLWHEKNRALMEGGRKIRQPAAFVRSRANE